MSVIAIYRQLTAVQSSSEATAGQSKKQTVKRVLLILLPLVLATQLTAQKASDAWKKVLKNCAQSDSLSGEYVLFFGVSNTIGPGSVWHYGDHKSIRLVFELSDAFPDSSTQADIIKINNTASCSGKSDTNWNLGLGLPFSTDATPLSLDIDATLKKAKQVTVSIQGFALDDLKETNWKKAFAGLPSDNVYVKEIKQQDRIVADNVVKVTGFKAVFDYKTSIGADAVAKYQGSSFTLGNSSPNPGQQTDTGTAGTGTSNSGQQSKQEGTNTSAGTTDKPRNAQRSKSGANKSGSEFCSLQGATAANEKSGNTQNDTSNSGKKGSPGTGSATLHVAYISEKQITICADGPFYVIGSYANIVNEADIGLESATTSLKLTPGAWVPADGKAMSDRRELLNETNAH